MDTKVSLINTSIISHNYLCVCVHVYVSTFKIYDLSHCQVYEMLLTINNNY